MSQTKENYFSCLNLLHHWTLEAKKNGFLFNKAVVSRLLHSPLFYFLKVCIVNRNKICCRSFNYHLIVNICFQDEKERLLEFAEDALVFGEQHRKSELSEKLNFTLQKVRKVGLHTIVFPSIFKRITVSIFLKYY